jgi:dienelactone hydrolase
MMGPVSRMLRTALWLASAVLWACNATAVERVSVSSLDAPQGKPIALPGYWFAAPVTGPAPAWVLLHGCGGPYARDDVLSLRMRQYAKLLNGQGMHALVLDSLTPRGERELCTQPTGERKVTQTQRRRDALGALRWLAARPDVERERLGLLGWSNGGSTVLAATNLAHPEVAAAAVRASHAVAFYPGCEDEERRGYRPSAPLLLLLGEADDWTPVAPCKALAAHAANPTPQLHSYPGAFHGFDGTAPLRLRNDVPNGANPGQGVHVGGDAAARDASQAELLRFLRSIMSKPGS